jgi:hypothetical protein
VLLSREKKTLDVCSLRIDGEPDLVWIAEHKRCLSGKILSECEKSRCIAWFDETYLHLSMPFHEQKRLIESANPIDLAACTIDGKFTEGWIDFALKDGNLI